MGLLECELLHVGPDGALLPMLPHSVLQQLRAGDAAARWALTSHIWHDEAGFFLRESVDPDGVLLRLQLATGSGGAVHDAHIALDLLRRYTLLNPRAVAFAWDDVGEILLGPTDVPYLAAAEVAAAAAGEAPNSSFGSRGSFPGRLSEHQRRRCVLSRGQVHVLQNLPRGNATPTEIRAAVARAHASGTLCFGSRVGLTQALRIRCRDALEQARGRGGIVIVVASLPPRAAVMCVHSPRLVHHAIAALDAVCTQEDLADVFDPSSSPPVFINDASLRCLPPRRGRCRQRKEPLGRFDVAIPCLRCDAVVLHALTLPPAFEPRPGQDSPHAFARVAVGAKVALGFELLWRRCPSSAIQCLREGASYCSSDALGEQGGQFTIPVVPVTYEAFDTASFVTATMADVQSEREAAAEAMQREAETLLDRLRRVVDEAAGDGGDDAAPSAVVGAASGGTLPADPLSFFDEAKDTSSSDGGGSDDDSSEGSEGSWRGAVDEFSAALQAAMREHDSSNGGHGGIEQDISNDAALEALLQTDLAVEMLQQSVLGRNPTAF